MQISLWKKGLVLGINVLLIGISIVPSGGMVIKKELPTELIIYGPTFGEIGISYEYNFYLFDSEGCDFFLLVDWGDGTNTGWIGPYVEGETATANHIWYDCGYYTIIAVAKCNDSNYNASLTVAITDGNFLLDENFSGIFPPDGWSTNSWTQCNLSCCGFEPPCACLLSNENFSNYITSKAIDASDYEIVYLRFASGIDIYYPNYCYFFIKCRKNETSPWEDITPWDNPFGTGFCDWVEIEINCGPEGCGDALQINWTFIGYYYYYKQVCLDDVIIYNPPNNRPNIPTIDGPTKGKPGVEYNYTFVTSDHNNDTVCYYIDWYSSGDVFCTDWYASGEEVILNHTWPEYGTFTISAMAMDSEGAESNWSEFEVEIPRNRATIDSFFKFFLGRFPLLGVFLRAIYLLR